jgi:hypothetical protein
LIEGMNTQLIYFSAEIAAELHKSRPTIVEWAHKLGIGTLTGLGWQFCENERQQLHAYAEMRRNTPYHTSWAGRRLAHARRVAAQQDRSSTGAD